MTQKITIIGGSGFIGTYLCRELENQGADFEIIDLNISKSFPTKTKVADVRNIESLRKTITGNIIINLAAIHSDNISDKTEYWRTNVDGAQNITTVCREKKIKKIIFTSSVAVYGFAKPGADELEAIEPFNEYGRTKFQAEEQFRKWHYEDQCSLIIIRPTVVFGEGNRGNVYNLISQIYSGKFIMVGNGQNKKSMAYVKNIAAFLNACVSADVSYGLYNYVDTPDFTMDKLVEIIRLHLKGKPSIGIKIPYWLGLILGHLADFVSKASHRKLAISAIRIKKFVSTTQFQSDSIHEIPFNAPFSLEQALENTLNHDFVSKNYDTEVFYTE